MDVYFEVERYASGPQPLCQPQVLNAVPRQKSLLVCALTPLFHFGY